MKRSIWIGYDPRETEAFVIARRTMRSWAPGIPIDSICLDDMRDLGLYTRPTSTRGGRMWDDISGAYMATEFAVSRFLVPHLAKKGWALFVDCDVLVRSHVHELFHTAELNPDKALYCVKHNHVPPQGEKMDGQVQSRYARKNWSSVMLFNCDHPSNQKLTVEMVNAVPGRDLHRFSWLDDHEIGSLDPAWNFLVGHTDPAIEPKIVHFTEGGPWFAAYRDVPYALEWLEERRAWLEEEARVAGRPTTWTSKFVAAGAHTGC